MKKSLRIATASLTGVLVFGATGAVAWWDHQTPRTPILTGATSPGVEHVQAADARATLACPGPPALASLGEGEDVDFEPEYAPDTGDATSLVTAISLQTPPDGPAPTTLKALTAKGSPAPGAAFELSGSGAVHNGVFELTTPAQVTATPQEGAVNSPIVAALQFGVATAGDLRGFAAASCVPVAADHWLVGAQTEAGSSAELQLMNPSDTPASVRFEVWGAAGPIELVGNASMLVPPGEHRSILLEGLAPGERRLAVRVRASGARIGAAIQDVRTLGLEPGGVDYVTPSAAPSPIVAFPGLEIKDDDTALLRLFVPGEAPGEVDVRLIGPTGEIAADDLRGLAVSGGAVTDVPLAGVPAGTYTAIVEGTVPLTGSAFLATGAEATPRDIAWLPATPRDEYSVFALPDSSISRAQTLVVAGVETDAVAQVYLATDAGELVATEQLFVAAGESRSTRIPASIDTDGVVGVVVEADQPVATGFIIRSEKIDGGAVSLLPPTPSSVLPGGVDVRLVQNIP